MLMLDVIELYLKNEEVRALERLIVSRTQEEWSMKPIRIPREEKQDLIQQLEDYIIDQTGEAFGNIAAEGLFDHVLSLVTPYVYNQAITDARTVVSEEWSRLEDELNVLERPINRRR